MRISTIAAFAMLWSISGMAPAQAANDGFWCYRDFGKAQYSNCSFGTARQCLSFAGIVGGVCERNHQAETVPPVPRKPRAQRS